jgi:hypothetical protein
MRSRVAAADHARHPNSNRMTEMNDAEGRPRPGRKRGGKVQETSTPSVAQPNNEDNRNSRVFQAALPKTDPSPDPFDLEAQKTDLVAAPEEANLKETEPFATAQTIQPKLRVRAR